MKIKVINNVSYQKFPITDDMVDYDEDALKQIGITKQFDKNGNIVDYVDCDRKIKELKQKLFETDYQVLKWKEGELTDEQFEPMRLQRKKWREEIRSLGG